MGTINIKDCNKPQYVAPSERMADALEKIVKELEKMNSKGK